MNENLLVGTMCYLAGPIEYAAGFGINWRINISRELEARFHIVALNPMEKQAYFRIPESIQEEELSALKRPDNFDEYARAVKDIIRYDLRMVHLADFMIIHHTPGTVVCGTPWEACVASSTNKPILILTAGKKEDINGWYFGALDHNLFFDNQTAMFEYLEKVNRGEVSSNQWLL
jgi:hypothetical protein